MHRPLTAAQREYAALDAFALLWIKDASVSVGGDGGGGCGGGGGGGGGAGAAAE